MDTVASVGIWEGIKNDQLKLTGGHANWAFPEVMRILPNVQNCVHFVAMHELRKNFPLDSVAVKNIYPKNCVEVAYPGSHSDVGGGYEPGELGVSLHENLKLSQIPLNHMYQCAVTSGVPLSKERLGSKSEKDFEMSENLITAYERFLDVSNETPKALNDWALPYLTWRWQRMNDYEKTEHYKKANEEGQKLLMAGNISFIFGDELIKNYQGYSNLPFKKLGRHDREIIPAQLMGLDPQAPEIRSRVKSHVKIAPELAEFFDRFVHDSVSGFRKQLVEPTGHWRYRKIFRGTATPYNG